MFARCSLFGFLFISLIAKVEGIFMPTEYCWNKLTFRKPSHLHLNAIDPIIYPWVFKGHSLDPKKIPILFFQKKPSKEMHIYKMDGKCENLPFKIDAFDSKLAKVKIYDFNEKRSFELELNQRLYLSKFQVKITFNGETILFTHCGEKKLLNNTILMLLDFHPEQGTATILEHHEGIAPLAWILFKEQNEQENLT